MPACKVPQHFTYTPWRAMTTAVGPEGRDVVEGGGLVARDEGGTEGVGRLVLSP